MELRIKIQQEIGIVESRFGYEFETYEVDNVLLEIVKERHEAYLNKKFGYIRIDG